MPIYEYECSKCGLIEEAIQKFSDKPLSKCKHCSGKLNKLVSQSAFHLKGSGWYVTDYANKKSSHSTSKADTDSTKTASGANETSSADKKSKKAPD